MEIAPPPRSSPEAGNRSLEITANAEISETSEEAMDRDAMAGELESDTALDDVDALLRDEGLETTPLPELPRLPPEPMRMRPGAGGATGASLVALRDRALAIGMLAVVGGVIALLFWLGFRLA